MIRRRYPVILGALCGSLLAVAALCFSRYSALSAEIDAIFSAPDGGVVSDETYLHYDQLSSVSQAIYGLITPAVLAAAIAGIAMLILLVLRSRTTVRRAP